MINELSHDLLGRYVRKSDSTAGANLEKQVAASRTGDSKAKQAAEKEERKRSEGSDLAKAKMGKGNMKVKVPAKDINEGQNTDPDLIAQFYKKGGKVTVGKAQTVPGELARKRRHEKIRAVLNGKVGTGDPSSRKPNEAPKTTEPKTVVRKDPPKRIIHTISPEDREESLKRAREKIMAMRRGIAR